VSSGQVFRWQEMPDGRWLGVDGADYYLVEFLSNSELRVQSNATWEAFWSLFRLDWNAEAIEREVRAKDPLLEPYFEMIRGLRVMRPTATEETFFSFLCTPNNNVARITQMVRQLASYGPLVATIESYPVHLFPTAELIASIPEAELRDRKFGYRAATITSAARQLLDKGPGWLDELKKAPYREAHEELLTIKGIGRKLADCIALFALDHGEAVPIDTHIWQQVVRLYRPDWQGKSLTDTRYLEAGQIFRDRFGGLAGWAHQYLFYENLLNWRSR
jgi:N-glycosylase/DNA lyase